ncbi:MAG: hypothetical protein K8H85_00045 [Cyclobacteriaceae bacterium]|nr:hypothetical protein [Cyclobacteriaceae bacterium]
MDNAIFVEFEEESKNRTYTGPAKRLLEKLAQIGSHVESYQKRWFWELVQNACDYNDKVKVELEITPEFIVFRHNGKPFNIQQVMNLIRPDSDKDEVKNREVVGQYGSGFVSTHILSAEIDVKGVLLGKDGQQYSFKFTLNREHLAEKTLLAKSIEQSEKEFKEGLKVSHSNDPYTTEFKYKIQTSYSFVQASDTIESGKSFIEEVLPYVFAFQNKLVEVCITEGEAKSIYSCTHENDNTVLTKVIDYVNDAPQGEATICIQVFEHEGVFVAAEKRDQNICAYPENLPRLFKAYPLIGTEEFPFPCIIHSLDLIPTLERNAIELSENDSANRQVISKAVTAFGEMLKTNCDENSYSIHNISRISPGNFDSKINEWFKMQVSDKLKQTLLDTPIVITNSGRAILREVKVPVIKDELYSRYHDILSKTNFKIPIEGESAEWTNVLNFSVFTDTQFDLKTLLNSILGQNKTVNTFLQPNIDGFEWVKTLVSLILDSDEKSLLYDNPIVPQQDNKLRPLKGDLYWDNEISDELKNILELISEHSFRSILMHQSMEEIGGKLLDSKKEKSEKDILDAIDKALQKAAQLEQDANFIDALRRLLKWTSSMEDTDLKDKMPWFATERALLVMKTLASESNRDLAFKIIQSGKIEVLAQLAELNISEERLNTIIDLGKSDVALEDINQIISYATDLPMETIIKSLEELKVEEVDRAFKTEQGTSIERLVEDLMNEDGLDKIYECKLRSYGEADFIIKNLRNGNEAFLEIKSHAHDSKLPSKLYTSQAKKAVACTEKDNYILGVITRPKDKEKNIPEYIREHMRFTFGIGKKLEPLVIQYVQLEPFQSSPNGVSVEFEGKDVKFTIDRSLTNNGHPFGGFKARLKQILEN